jgi:hypothetical protein
MSKLRTSKQPKRPRRSLLSVGDRATLRSGEVKMSVEIVEDRGRIGTGGRHLMRVRLVNEPSDESNTFEVPADELVRT